MNLDNEAKGSEDSLEQRETAGL
ncbi:MAG: hypothetical protein RL402_670, partial [Actinomycetota bacterium]